MVVGYRLVVVNFSQGDRRTISRARPNKIHTSGGRTIRCKGTADIQTLLYINEGIEEARKIWKEFEAAREGIRERGGAVESEDRELEWGRDEGKSTLCHHVGEFLT